jgi:outer membrane protein assembly factor BamE (lipoprotein component of BamABCDE complex)
MIRILTGLLLIFAIGCASSGGNVVDSLREGMDKDEVLRKAGDPKRTYRSNGQDHWIYVFYKTSEEYSRTVTFEDGKIIRIGRAVAKKNWDKEMEKLERK